MYIIKQINKLNNMSEVIEVNYISYLSWSWRVCKNEYITYIVIITFKLLLDIVKLHSNSKILIITKTKV